MLERLLRGALGGLLATAIMSAVMFGARALGLLHTPPPKEITARAGRKAGAEPRRQSADTFNATWLAAHLGFGLGCGVVFALLRPYVPGGRTLPGLVYGALIWATSYLGVMPALGLYPWPSEDSTSRTAVMIVAHEVFGASLAATQPKRR